MSLTVGGKCSTGTIGATATLDAAVAIDDIIVVALALFDSVASAATFSDSLGNTYTQIVAVSLTGDGDSCAFYRCQVTHAGTPTIALSTGSPQERAWCAQAYSGIATSAFDVASTGGHGTSTAPAAGPTSATSQADEVVIMMAGNTLNGTLTYSAGAGGFTVDTQFGNGAQVTSVIAHKVVAATGAQSGALSMSASAEWGAVVATFKLAGGGGGGGGATNRNIMERGIERGICARMF